MVRTGTDVAILAVGSMVLPAERAADRLQDEGISAAVVNARFIKPLDKRLIKTLAESTGALVTVEENARAGGFGSAVLEALEELEAPVTVRVLGVPDRVFEQASQGRLRELAGLTASDIADAARGALSEKTRRPSHRSVAATHRVG
jgi:1-deoxy-D-xylulose-5-phosphate synthase